MDQKKNAPGKSWGYLVKILGKKKKKLSLFYVKTLKHKIY